MDTKDKKGSLIQMNNLARKKFAEFNADAVLDMAISKIQERRKSKPIDFKSKKLINEISTPEHLRRIFENGHESEVSREEKK